MRHDKASAAARESAAFLRGFAYGVEQTINAHDDLIGVMPLALLCIRETVGEHLFEDTDERVMAAMAEVRRVREAGALESLSMFEVERVMQRGSS